MLTCPYCGGKLIELGGANGNPFDANRKTIVVCLNCQRTVYEQSEDILDYVNPVIKITATAAGGGATKTAECTVPFASGMYPLKGDYPFGRTAADENPPFAIDRITIKGTELIIAGEKASTEELPKVITKKLTAFGYGNVPTEEIITLKIDMDFEM